MPAGGPTYDGREVKSLQRIAQAGTLAVRGRGAEAEVLIIGSKKNPGTWTFPKGHIEKGETAAEAALRELREEAGIVAEIVKEIGTSRFSAANGDVEVTYFLVRFTGHANPDENRPMQWLDFDAARKIVSFADAGRLLKEAARALVP